MTKPASALPAEDLTSTTDPSDSGFRVRHLSLQRRDGQAAGEQVHRVRGGAEDSGGAENKTSSLYFELAKI